MIDNCPSRAVARYIANTIKRGPTPREVAIYKRWAGEAKKRAQQEAAWADLASEYRAGIA